MKLLKRRIKNNNNTLLYNKAQISSRFMAYVMDEVLLISIISLIAAQLGYFPVLFLASFRYLSNEHPILPNSYFGNLYPTILIFLVISVIYYLLEAKIGYSLGGFISRNKLVEVSKDNKKQEKKKLLTFAIINSLVKSFILVELINSAFALKEKLSQTYLEKKFNIITITKRDPKKRFIETCHTNFRNHLFCSNSDYFVHSRLLQFFYYITTTFPSNNIFL